MTPADPPQARETRRQPLRLEDIEFRYRSFDPGSLEGLGQINVLIGQNNAGKSSILGVISSFAAESRREHEGRELPTIDFDGGSFTARFSLDRVAPLSKQLTNQSAAARFVVSVSPTEIHERVEGIRPDNIIRSDPDRPGEFPLSINTVFQHEDGTYKDCPLEEHIGGLSNFRTELTRIRRGTFFLKHSRGGATPSPDTSHPRLHPDAANLAGGLEQLLSERPASFHVALQGFISSVLPDVGDVVVQRSGPPGDLRAEVFFESASGCLPLAHLGGGVEQTLMIAVALLGEPEARLLLLEEPETHLHEAAQRRLLEQIQAHLGSKQLIVATHSPVFMNGFDDARVYHVEKVERLSTATPCVASRAQRRVLDSLEILPSTLLQTNCVIWIEGPTELLLLRHWLGMIAPELREHEHFALVMTAGSLLSHVMPSDEDINPMLGVCRHAFAICDRDASPDDPPSKLAAQKVAGLLAAHNSWTTDDYEIEWYFPPRAVESVWQVGAGALFTAENRGQPFYAALAETFPKARVQSAGNRKTHFAGRIIEASPEPHDWFETESGVRLRGHLDRLVAFIGKANPQLRRESPETGAKTTTKKITSKATKKITSKATKKTTKKATKKTTKKATSKATSKATKKRTR